MEEKGGKRDKLKAELTGEVAKRQSAEQELATLKVAMESKIKIAQLEASLAAEQSIRAESPPT